MPLRAIKSGLADRLAELAEVAARLQAQVAEASGAQGAIGGTGDPVSDDRLRREVAELSEGLDELVGDVVSRLRRVEEVLEQAAAAQQAD